MDDFKARVTESCILRLSIRHHAAAKGQLQFTSLILYPRLLILYLASFNPEIHYGKLDGELQVDGNRYLAVRRN